ncbi:MAG: cupredoxin domain-containing protein [Caldilineaceae bacterium]|nr:cupredoxin domain-containing protein [Caldilineaceae bacterium]
MSQFRWAWLCILVLFALLLAACNNASADGSITLQASGMSFVHDKMTVKAGQPVTLQLVNRDGYGHAFDIDEFDIHTQLPSKQTLTVTFTPDKSGRYEFYCGTPGHRAAGMVGTLIVQQ